MGKIFGELDLALQHHFLLISSKILQKFKLTYKLTLQEPQTWPFLVFSI